MLNKDFSLEEMNFKTIQVLLLFIIKFNEGRNDESFNQLVYFWAILLKKFPLMWSFSLCLSHLNNGMGEYLGLTKNDWPNKYAVSKAEM
jgi:hypothetical protein